MLPLLALFSAAWAEDVAGIDILQTALLNEAAYGNHADAMRGYNTLVREHALNDPLRTRAQLQLALSKYALGDLDGARAAAKEGIRTDTCKSACNLLIERIELEQNAVRTIPVRWNFSDGENGLLKPWIYEGLIRVQTREETANPALIWSTFVDVRKRDQLVVGFEHPTPAPTTVSFRIQAAERDSALRVRVEDDMGRAYGLSTGPIRVAADRPTVVEIALADLAPATPDHPPLDRGSISRLYLEDVSAFSGTALGPHALHLDDFAIE